MFNDLNYDINHEHLKDFHRQAQKRRLIKQARLSQHQRAIYHPFMSWLGRRMVSWGMRLMIQSREWDRRAENFYMQEHAESTLRNASTR